MITALAGVPGSLKTATKWWVCDTPLAKDDPLADEHSRQITFAPPLASTILHPIIK